MPCLERRAIDVRGIVQGVGFRPYVFHLASHLQLRGFVRNETGGVHIEVEGERRSIEQFLEQLADRPPPLAQIEHLSWQQRPLCGEPRFRIESSAAHRAGPVFISPDVATCSECLRELCNPSDRRHRYPFINCTHCGPRLTIVTAAPYDRPNTTMAGFAMCRACRAEYEDPRDRRFHAQPIACPDCGPRLCAREATGAAITVTDVIGWFVDGLRAGRIGALKGLGGYHLACDAENSEAVAELRRRKQRDEKPFALMVPHVAAALEICHVDRAERALLQSPAAPIVLLRRRTPSRVSDQIAPGNPWLGLMLPYSPLHHLILDRAGGMVLVMTSGNRCDEPIAYRDDEAIAKLVGIADLFLTHDRPIQLRCDDSVTRVIAAAESPVRRSRGYAPRPIDLPFDCPLPTLAVGGQLKATFAWAQGRQAFLSHHLGDLDHLDAYQAFQDDVHLYEQLFGVRPGCIVHDLHPEYSSTRYAIERSAEECVPRVAVQHHHAHLASCMAEHGLEAAIGVIFDGTGYGSDGAIWGGEFLVGGYAHAERVAHLRYVGMPGGDRAIREPWRMALAHLADAGVACPSLLARQSPVETRTVHRMLERQFQVPSTSSVGRLFDAVAALAGVRDRVSYEGQAAVELEWLASGVEPAGTYPVAVSERATGEAEAPRWIVDTRPLIAAVAADAAHRVEPATIARRFHSTIAQMIADVCGRIRRNTGLGVVALSGGVFLNALLTVEVLDRLTRDGFQVYRHRLVPAGDGGLSLGQLAVAATVTARTASRRADLDQSLSGSHASACDPPSGPGGTREVVP